MRITLRNIHKQADIISALTKLYSEPTMITPSKEKLKSSPKYALNPNEKAYMKLNQNLYNLSLIIPINITKIGSLILDLGIQTAEQGTKKKN